MEGILAILWKKTFGSILTRIGNSSISGCNFVELRWSSAAKFVDVAVRSIPLVKEALDISPAGDIKVVLTGTNFKGEEKSRLGAVGWLALDFFGGEMLSSLAKASRSVKLITGAGGEIIERVVRKAGNLSNHLDELHIRAAVNDIFGNPVVIDGKVYDHLKEVKNALNGIGKQIKVLNKLISTGKLEREAIEAATELRNNLQIQKDGINEILNRATKSVKNKANRYGRWK